MLNHIVTMGRLVRDPELRHTQSGLPVCSFSIACERDFKDANGNKPVDYLDIVAWRKTAEFVNQYMAKGRLVVVEGRVQHRDWIDRDGMKRRSTEVVANSVHFGDSKPKDQQGQEAPAPSYAAVGAYSGGYGAEDFEDPF